MGWNGFSKTVASRWVESTTGAVAVGRKVSCSPAVFTLPVPYQFGPLPRFQSPLVKPDMQISRIRLSPIPSDLRSRQVDASPWDAEEAERLVEILVWDLAEPSASSSLASHQPAADPSFSVCSNKLINLYDRSLVKVAAPATYHAADASHRADRFIRIPLPRRPLMDTFEQALHRLP
jgi:hypothetical protein